MNEFRVKYPELPKQLQIPPTTLETRNVEAAEQSAAATQQATQVAERSLTIAERSLWFSAGFGIITLVIAGVTAWYAARALSTWRAQMFGEHQYGSAMAALKALKAIRDLMVERRASLDMKPRPPAPINLTAASIEQEMRAAQAATLARASNFEGQQAHYEFAIALTGQRDALEQALVGLEPQWGTEFQRRLDAASERIRHFADASKIKEDLFSKYMAPSLREVQQARTPESEQTESQHRALLWMGVPALNVNDSDSEQVRLLEAQTDILLPITQLEEWLLAKLADLTGQRSSAD